MEHNHEQQQDEPAVPERDDRRIEPRIYVASLSDYNAGRLHGTWLNASDELEELEDGVSGMLAASPTPGAEEWAIHDYEGFGPLPISEYESLATVNRIARGIGEHGAAYAHFASLVGTSDPDVLDRFEDTYLGCYESLEAYATEFLDDLGYLDAIEAAAPDALQPYVKIDIEGFARDLELSGNVTTASDEQGVYVFDMGQ